MRKGILLLGVLAICAMAVAGCGGGGGTTGLTKAEFVKQANAACKESEQERTQLFKEAQEQVKPGDNFGQKEKKELVKTVAVDPYLKMTKAIEELGAPEGDEQEIEALIKEMEQAAKSAEANPDQAIKTIIPFAEANKAADEYGLTDCVV